MSMLSLFDDGPAGKPESAPAEHVEIPSVGADRDRYSREVEHRPSRFASDDRYRAWAARADRWAAANQPTATNPQKEDPS